MSVVRVKARRGGLCSQPAAAVTRPCWGEAGVQAGGSVSDRCRLPRQREGMQLEDFSPWQGEMLLDRRQLSPRGHGVGSSPTPMPAAPPPPAMTATRRSAREVGRSRETEAQALLEVEATNEGRDPEQRRILAADPRWAQGGLEDWCLLTPAASQDQPVLTQCACTCHP